MITGRRVLILGDGSLARSLSEAFEGPAGGGRSVAILSDGGNSGASMRGRPVLGGLEDLPSVLRDYRPQRIVLALSERRRRLPLWTLIEARLRGVEVEEGIEALERLTGKLRIEDLSPGALLFGRRLGPTLFGRLGSRVLSVAVALAGIVLLAPLLALIALLIRIDSGGPILFVQERAGRGGRRFRLLKFRTMHPAARVVSEWAGDNVHRITRVGGWLRRFRLDELPQFVNILRGDMNLVGPRPHPASNVGLFETRIPYYRLRGAVRPGVTGWAQVRQGYANGLDEETEKMRFDLYYIRHQSLALDLRILLDTVRIVALGREHGDERPLPARAPRSPGLASRIPLILPGSSRGRAHSGLS